MSTNKIRLSIVFLFLSIFLIILSVKSPITKTEPYDTAVLVAKDFKQQVNCLAKNIYYEAAFEPYEGKLAVAQVTMNRTRDSNFPSNPCDVVYQRTHKTCQFSWTCMKMDIAINKYEWQEAELIAHKALTQPVLHDKLANENALYYHAVYVRPGWKGKVVTKIGNHIFYASLRN